MTSINDANFHSAISDWSISGEFSTYGDIIIWDTAGVTDMSFAFHNMGGFNEDISGWNMGNVSNTQSMFQGAQAFNEDISGWNMGEVTNTSQMFQNASKFNKDIGDWNMGNVLDITNMIYGASAFDRYIGDWKLDISKITGLIIKEHPECGYIIHAYLEITDSNRIFIINDQRSLCPVKAIPIIVPGNDKTRAFSYARLVNNAFGSSTRGYRSMKITVPVPENASGLPGGTRPPPRNF